MNVLVLGRRGLGKSTLAVWKARELNRHVIAWSPNAQFQNADMRTADLDELIDWIDDHEDDEQGDEYYQYFLEYIPDGDMDADFTRFGDTLWAFDDFVLVIDEAHEIQTPFQINKTLARYIRQAPRREKGEERPVDLIQTSHFPVDLNKLSIGLADEAYIFRLTRERDMQRVEEEFGEQVARAVEETRTPETDPPGRDVVRVDIETRRFEVITDPSEWNTRVAKPREHHGIRLVG